MGCGTSSESSLQRGASDLSKSHLSPRNPTHQILQGSVILVGEDEPHHTVILGRSMMSTTTGVHIADIGAMETLVQASPRPSTLNHVAPDAIKNPLICLRAASPMPQREGREMSSYDGAEHLELSCDIPSSPRKPSPILIAAGGLSGASLVSPNSSNVQAAACGSGSDHGATCIAEKSLTRKRSNLPRTTNLLVPTGRDDLDIASEARTPRCGTSPRPNSLHATPLTFPTYLDKDGFEKDDVDVTTSPEETITEFVSLLPPRGSYSSITAAVRCPACHMELIVGARFCHECGKRVFPSGSTTSAPGMLNDVASCSFSVLSQSQDPMTPTVTGSSPAAATAPPGSARKLQRVYHRQVKIARNALIGKGTKGCVYKALDVATGKPLAVKEMELDFTDPEEVKNIRTELRHLSALRHPHVVEYFGCMVEENKVLILMERLECGTLLDLVNTFKSGLPEEAVRSFTRQILLAVAYCHGVGTTHRDIKPANILQSASGILKLSDFGSAMVATNDVKLHQTVAGTPAYMPPEMLEMMMQHNTSFEVGQAHDIWSLGCTVHELLTGRKPWAHLGLEPMALLFRMHDLQFEIDPSLSPDATDFLHACLERDMLLRPTASDLLEHPFIRDVVIDGEFLEDGDDEYGV